MNSYAQRIAVIGISGSGKTTFSEKLRHLTGLPVYHMDKLYWGKNWMAIPEKEWLVAEQGLIEKEQWIIEGYINSLSAQRLQQADKIIYLDFSGIYCAINGLKRWFTYKCKDRPELPEGCKEKFNLKYLWTMLNRRERRDIEEVLKMLDANEKLDRIKYPENLDKYFKS